MQSHGDLPWLEDARNLLGHMASEERVAPALLIRGPSGTGKTHLARVYAQRLLCRSPIGIDPCQRCVSCLLFMAGTHPDYQFIAPEEPGKPIKIEAIRRMIQSISLAPQYGGYRAILIDEADALNGSAANALLKTLEEPPEGTLLILVTDRPELLPATVRSRLRSITIRMPERDLVLAWLAAMGCSEQDREPLLNAASGSPLGALALDAPEVLRRRLQCFEEFLRVFEGLDDPLQIAESWLSGNLDLELEWLAGWFRDLSCLAMGSGLASVFNRDLEEGYGVIIKHSSARFLMESYGRVIEMKSAMLGPANKQLILEGFLLSWAGPHSLVA